VKFLLSIILWLGVSSAIYGAVALVINPNQTGPLHFFAPALVDDRVPKTDLFRKFASSGPVDGLVLGSSRTLSISPRLLASLTGKRYFNFAISAAKMSEVEGIYEDVLRTGAHPRHVVIGLDVNYLLARKKVEERQLAIARGALVPRLAQLLLDLRTVYTVEYAHDMFLWFEYQAGMIPPKAGNTFDPDGTRVADGRRVVSREQVQGAVSGCAGLMHTQFARYDGLSEIQFAELRKLLARAAADGARVEFFTTPFNPNVQSEMVEGTAYNELRDAAMQRLTEELRPFHSSVHDLAKMSSLPSGEEGWSDCVHYSEQIGEAIIRQILATEGN
jgi:hypothetical protein